MNMSVVRVDTLVSKIELRMRVNETQMTKKEKRLREWSRECSFTKCDVCFLGKRQAHSKLFN